MIFVNVIQRETGIETTAPSEVDPFAQAAARLHRRADERKLRTAAQLQAFVLLPRVADVVRFQERSGRRGLREAFQDELADTLDHAGSILLVKNRVIQPRGKRACA